jgi:endoglucanase
MARRSTVRSAVSYWSRRSTAWLNLLDQLKISYANWTYSDAAESSAAFKAGTCAGSTYAGTGVLNESGVFVPSRIRTPDNFPTS